MKVIMHSKRILSWGQMFEITAINGFFKTYSFYHAWWCRMDTWRKSKWTQNVNSILIDIFPHKKIIKRDILEEKWENEKENKLVLFKLKCLNSLSLTPQKAKWYTKILVTVYIKINTSMLLNHKSLTTWRSSWCT